ncbi:molecular chaperone [Rosenbergiella collisarenosi]|uniref:fimbrial biogenesis chaperone n=1 Tax=Rosenbergiella collisarenosi TaxID=1544695 RepID=UPI001BD9FF62|nr:molecular chaperone [Rosenbergiella collisarenosi]MBT0721206.1 molecular chaperone [Rosenbergiella collisarenosi]
MKIIRLLALFITIFCVGKSNAAGNALLVWPILQTIEADQSGSALWLENRGDSDIHLQVRIFSWQQRGSQDHYADQTEVVASPPFIDIPPRQKQLVRLIRTGAVPRSGEQAYRIILDQLPPSSASSPKDSAGLQLQMRYVLPLFTYAQGVWTQPRTDKPRDAATATTPALSWSVARQTQPQLTITNHGQVHARLTDVFFAKQPILDGSAVVVNKGLLGYVLAGQSMTFPLPKSSQDVSTLHLYAKLEDNGQIIALR